jgi:RNA polymerase sigma-70 factor, ECF subfamily
MPETRSREPNIIRENALIEQAKKDPAGFKPLYEQYYKQIFLFVLRRVDDRMLCADITSQVFLKALQNIGRYEIRTFHLSSWLYRIAINEVNEHFRRHNKLRMVTIDKNVEEVFSALFVNSADSDIDDEGRLVTLARALQTISKTELALIELRFFESRPFAEIAQIMDKSEVYVKVKTYRTLEKLKKYIVKVR